MFFLGWAICALIIPPRADKIGRKLIILISLVLTSFAMIVILFAGNLVWLVLASLLLGLTAPGRITVAFVYLMEFITPEWKTFAASLSSLLFVMCFVTVTMYLKFISATAIHLIAFGILLGLTSSVCIYYLLPESPLFLIKTGQIDKAEKVIHKIFTKNLGTTKCDSEEPVFNFSELALQ